jgi:hypothetical protein
MRTATARPRVRGPAQPESRRAVAATADRAAAMRMRTEDLET